MTYAGNEFALQRYVIDLLRLTARRNVVWFAVPNGEYRSPRTGARLKAMGVVPGVADVVLVIPPGQAHFLELKAAKGRQSAEQREFEEWAASSGAPYAIARSPEEARRLLADWGAIDQVMIARAA